jgi:hypothetical protein
MSSCRNSDPTVLIRTIDDDDDVVVVDNQYRQADLDELSGSDSPENDDFFGDFVESSTSRQSNNASKKGTSSARPITTNRLNDVPQQPIEGPDGKVICPYCGQSYKNRKTFNAHRYRDHKIVERVC